MVVAVEIRQLEHFVAAVDQGTLRRAAAVCHISQPGLSMSLRRLEEFLGTELLERGPRGVTPTPYGETLLGHARLILAHARRAAEQIAALRGRGVGGLRIGVGASFMNGALACAVARLLEARPGFALHVEEGVAEDQIPRVADGRLDLAFGRFPSARPHADLEYAVLHRRELCAWVRKGHPLARSRRPPTPEVMVGFRWIVPDDAPDEIAIPIYRELARRGIEAQPVVETNSVSFLKRLLTASDCVALLPEGAVADEVHAGALVRLPLPGLDLRDEVGAVWRRDLADLPTVQALIDAVREELPRLGLGA